MTGGGGRGRGKRASADVLSSIRLCAASSSVFYAWLTSPDYDDYHSVITDSDSTLYAMVVESSSDRRGGSKIKTNKQRCVS